MAVKQIVTLTDANFDAEVYGADQPVLIDFWAEWCGPCRMVAATIDALAEEYEGKAKIAKLNVDENPRASMRFNVRSIPTILVFDGGRLVETAVGVRPKAALEQLLAPYV